MVPQPRPAPVVALLLGLAPDECRRGRMTCDPVGWVCVP